ncbi:glycosyltransferase family 2 protein [Frigoribacterium sp. ACAM 257]|uniref:glycosyltransferase family 2 protein n=1 Tax=Frigoribacterium sp. ACAM 257 TaxID=2508998 RepID=UPI0011BA0BA0|nr:glycosyltransferase family 2 protein [Frigoribacterium sp. ACAM 257]TWX40281.1 glycosyltransferase family 2 protein [Frigoribacterium sp. ACAM 257]
MSPRLTVVIPSFNNADFIDETVRSVLSQDYDDFELVVADHSSADDTWQRLQAYADDPRVTLLQTPAGGGAPANWTRVTDAATGEYLRLVPGDDVLHPGTLRDHVEALDEQPTAVVASSPRSLIDASGATVLRRRGRDWGRRLVPGAEAVRATVRAGTNVFGEPFCVTFRRSALVEAGGWYPAFPYLIDQASYCRVLLRGDLVAVPSLAGGFRLSSTQWSVALSAEQSRQARGYHAELHREHPEVVSAGDRRLGDLRARLAAQSRRLVYLVLRRRMQAGERASGRR